MDQKPHKHAIRAELQRSTSPLPRRSKASRRWNRLRQPTTMGAADAAVRQRPARLRESQRWLSQQGSWTRWKRWRAGPGYRHCLETLAEHRPPADADLVHDREAFKGCAPSSTLWPSSCCARYARAHGVWKALTLA